VLCFLERPLGQSTVGHEPEGGDVPSDELHVACSDVGVFPPLTILMGEEATLIGREMMAIKLVTRVGGLGKKCASHGRLLPSPVDLHPTGEYTSVHQKGNVSLDDAPLGSVCCPERFTGLGGDSAAFPPSSPTGTSTVLIRFRTNKLEKQFKSGKVAIRACGPTIAKRYVQRIVMMQAAEKLEELKGLPGLNCHPLRGDRDAQWAVTLNAFYRLVFTVLDADGDEIRVEEVNKHYGD